MIINPIKIPVFVESESDLKLKELGIETVATSEKVNAYFFTIDVVMENFSDDGQVSSGTIIVSNGEDFLSPLSPIEILKIIEDHFKNLINKTA